MSTPSLDSGRAGTGSLDGCPESTKSAVPRSSDRSTGSPLLVPSGSLLQGLDTESDSSWAGRSSLGHFPFEEFLVKNPNTVFATELDLGETFGGDLAGEIRAAILGKTEGERLFEAVPEVKLHLVFRLEVVSSPATASYTTLDLSLLN
ncbi:hypothetical protein OUZ56_018683 [Daphnia magna]|uniref:Uncharacterized protein n=1 Tax=Daphnia magna TaxID=35525 RepID=A0ABQ9ZA37_9CRUS|nr:hypothetical protein OUZ56_018683 [Daphnia magna]